MASDPDYKKAMDVLKDYKQYAAAATHTVN
jgi:hypothetical protein